MSEEQRKKMSDRMKGKYIGDKNPHWKGGKVIVDGYRYIYTPKHPNATKDGYVCEHRLVMEKKIGRFLESGEVVHHLNHNVLDNSPDNLHLCPSPGRHFFDHHFKGRDKDNRNFI